MSTVPSAATVSRLEKVAVDNGFDRELGREGGWLCFASSPEKHITRWIAPSTVSIATHASRLSVSASSTSSLCTSACKPHWSRRWA